MARKTYTSAVEAYIDAELAAAHDERAHAATSDGEWVGESVSLTVLNVIRAMFARELQLARGTVLLALLPALVIAARAGLGALPQFGVATDDWLPWAVQGITIAAAVWAGLVTLWQARNSWRRARGQAPATLPFRRNPEQYFPPLEDILIKLGVAVAALAAGLWLAWSGGEPLWLLLALTALPPVFFITAIGFTSALSGLGAVGGVDVADLRPAPGSSPASAQLDDRIVRLQQIRDWLKDDKLKAMIDDVIGKQVAKSERRQVVYSVVVGVISLMAGWLLSTISPVSALAPLLPR
jgi:hypothetical protein